MELGSVLSAHVDIAVEAIAGYAGMTPETAREVIDTALRRELTDGYHGDDDDRARVLATLDTISALYERDWPAPRTGIEELELSFNLIDVDQEVQVRVNGVTPERVEQFMDAMEAGEVFPPITLFWDEPHRGLWLADGFHRIRAARRIRDRIRAHIYAGTRDDAAEYAATCNARHGLPMSPADKRAAVKRLLRLHEDWSSREIARRVNCDHKTVESIRQALFLSGEIPQIDERTVTRASSTYTYTPPAPKEPEPQTVEEWLDEHAPAAYQPVPAPEPRQAPPPIQRVASQETPREDWQRLEDALLQRDHRQLRSLLMTMPRRDFVFALVAIYRQDDALARYHDEAAQTILAAIFEPWDDSLIGGNTDEAHACPECGGELFLSLNNSGQGRLACKECGSILETA